MERLEFELLSSIAEGQDLSLRKETFGFSDEAFEAAKSQIIEKGWLDAEGITDTGLAALEPS